MQRIADERTVVLETLQEELSRLLDDLLQKYEKTISHEAKIRVAAAYIERLKARCHAMVQYGSSDEAEIESTQNDLERREQRLASLLALKNKPVVPSNSQIGAILAQKENVIATRLFRARKTLEKKLLDREDIL